MGAILHMFVSEKGDPMRLKVGSRTNSGKNSKDRQTQKPAAAERPLADYLCFAIYSANLAYGRAYKQGLQELGLTYPQWIAIVALGEEGDQTVSELGDRMFLESNTLTPMLKKLEATGYLRRQRDRADERQVRVSLTDAGRRLHEKGMHMTLAKSNGLKPDDFARLQKSVVTLRDNLIKATAEE
jgi:MarR family transcriptional regulator, organic hydroperoxide resistance regulator